MKRITVFITFLIAVLLSGIYFGGAFYYRNRFLKNVYVNDINVSGMTLEKANNKLGQSDMWSSISILSDKEEFLDVKAAEIDYQYVSSPNLIEIFKEQNKWKWPGSLFNDSIYTTPIVSTFNDDKLKSLIDNIGEFDKELLNAKIVYSSDSDSFIIEPHSYEIQITKDELFTMVAEAIEKRHDKLNIESSIARPDIAADDESIIEANNKANKYLNVQLKYDFGDREEIIDRSVIKDFIVINETDVDLDFDKTKDHVVGIARKYDTFGRGRKFQTASGNIITTEGGSYGWATQRDRTTEELIDHIKNGENKTIEPVYLFDALIRKADDIGKTYVEIDLEEQMVYAFVDGQLRVQTPTVTGNVARGNSTPVGVYPLNYKERDAVLTGENYASPVKYWMPFNKNVGMHDADWRDEFGGDIYKKNGSNGCINLPPADAKTIFDLSYPGMPVIVY